MKGWASPRTNCPSSLIAFSARARPAMAHSVAWDWGWRSAKKSLSVIRDASGRPQKRARAAGLLSSCRWMRRRDWRAEPDMDGIALQQALQHQLQLIARTCLRLELEQIGRASCRERV